MLIEFKMGLGDLAVSNPVFEQKICPRNETMFIWNYVSIKHPPAPYTFIRHTSQIQICYRLRENLVTLLPQVGKRSNK